jgi:DNA-binding transcriptional regulator YiaG
MLDHIELNQNAGLINGVEYVLKYKMTDPKLIEEFVTELKELYPGTTATGGRDFEVFLLGIAFAPKMMPSKIYILWPNFDDPADATPAPYGYLAVPSILYQQENDFVFFQLLDKDGWNFLQGFLNKVQPQTQKIAPQRLAVYTPFVNGIAVVPTSAPVMSGAMALMNPWTPNEHGEPRYKTVFKQGFIEHHIVPTEPSTDEITTFTKLTAWEITKCFDVHIARLHLLMSTYAIKSDEPWREEFTLKGTELIHILGNKRTDLTKHERLFLTRQQVATLGHLGVYIKWVQNKLNLCTEASRMWDLKITSIYDDLFEQQLDEVIIEGRAGLWAKGFLNRAGQESKTALFQYGYLADKILQIDPYHNPFAAKAMIYLTLQKQRQTFLVLTLLEKVVGQEGLLHARQDRRERHGLKQQFDDFLLTAKELQCTIEFDDKTYPKNIRPDFAQENHFPEYKSKLPKGYFESWLQAKITIELPEPIPTLLNTSKTSHTHKKQVKIIPTSLTGNTIRQAREAKGYSVRKLAQKLKLAPISVSRWESGQRKLTAENEKALRNILNIS